MALNQNLINVQENIEGNLINVQENIEENLRQTAIINKNVTEILEDNANTPNKIVGEWSESQNMVYSFSPNYVGYTWANINLDPNRYGIFNNVSLIQNDTELSNKRYTNFNWTEDKLISYTSFENYSNRNLQVITNSLSIKLKENNLFNQIKDQLSIITADGLYRGIYIMSQTELLNQDSTRNKLIDPTYSTMIFNPSNNDYTGLDLMYRDQSNCLELYRNNIQYLVKYKIEELYDRIKIDFLYINGDYSICFDKNGLNLNKYVPLISWIDTTGIRNVYKVPQYNNLPIQSGQYSIGSLKHYEFAKNFDDTYTIDYTKYTTDELRDGTLFGIPNLTSLAEERFTKNITESTVNKTIEFPPKDCIKFWYE